jgi:hypothetical protein
MKNQSAGRRTNLHSRRTTMHVREDGVIISEPTETPVERGGGGSPLATEIDGDGTAVAGECEPAADHTQESSRAWHAWFRKTFEHEVCDGDFFAPLMVKLMKILIDERVGPLEQQEKQIDELRLQLATAMGAIDVHSRQRSAAWFQRPETGNVGQPQRCDGDGPR